MGVGGTAVGEAAEISRSSKQRRVKSKLRRRRTRKSSANNSMKIKKNKQKQLKMKMKMKKRSSTNSQPDPDPLQQEQEQTNQVSENQSSKHSWPPHFDESYFVDEYFTYRTDETYKSVNRRDRCMPRILAHVVAEAEAQNSERCQILTKFAIDEFNKSSNANLELVLI